MNSRYCLLIILLLAVLVTGILVFAQYDQKVSIDEYGCIARPAKIRPDYSATVIPPNIAPLNFLVQEKGKYYCVKIYSKQGRNIEVFSRTPKIIIPRRPWSTLLNKNKGQDLYFDIFVKTENDQWNLFSTITNKIANENIDGHVVYRKIHPAHDRWDKMGVYQRDLRSYNESAVLENKNFKQGCVNCHTFRNNHTDKMLLGIRSIEYGSSAMLIENGMVNKIGTRFGYTSWHPSGQLAVYSINKIRQFFHSARNEVRDVPDLDSALAYYLIGSKTIKTSSSLSQKHRLETYPTWSPDGCYLYFCSAPMLWSDREKIPPYRYDEVKYDLVRVSYDLKHDRWGQVETVLSAENTGLSILEPRISPDGHWLLFCMCDYGSFPVYSQSSDLYMMDLKTWEETGQCKYLPLEINSDQSESWHSWSSNSRWIAFSSKKRQGKFTRIYFSYVDEAGKACKAVLMPQKDPEFYDFCLNTYSVPELVIEPVQITGEKIGRIVRASDKIEVDMPITMATPKAGQGSADEQNAIWRE